MQQIYLLFSASVQRWQVLKSHVHSFTLKPLSETRWECRVESVKAIRYQIGDVYDALIDLSETSDDRKCQSEAVSVAKELKSYTFLVTQCIWYEMLFQFNLLSKMMQSNDMELDNCLELLQKVQKFLIHFKADGFINLTYLAVLSYVVRRLKLKLIANTHA